jgi:hypothetical protein
VNIHPAILKLLQILTDITTDDVHHSQCHRQGHHHAFIQDHGQWHLHNPTSGLSASVTLALQTAGI